MLHLIAVCAVFIAAAQTLGILLIGGATETSSMLVIATALTQAFVSISTYVIGNAAMSASENNNQIYLQHFLQVKLKKYSYKSLFITSSTLIAFFILMQLNILKISLNENIILFAILILTCTPILINSMLFSIYRLRGKLVQYELTNLIANIISLVGVLFFLKHQNIWACGLFISLRSLLPMVMLIPTEVFKLSSRSLNYKRSKSIEVNYHNEAKKLLLGSIIFKLMTPFDRIIITAISPSSAIFLAIAQQIYSVFDFYTQKVKLNLLLHEKSLEIAEESRLTQNFRGHLSPALYIAILGFLYYLTAIIIWLAIGKYLWIELIGGDDSMYESIKIYMLLLFGQPICMSAAAYINGLFYISGKSETPVAIGVLTVIAGYLLKLYALYFGTEYWIPFAISIQYLTALLIMWFIAQKKDKK